MVSRHYAEADRPFDVAIIDMVMPGMNGLELLSNLKSLRASARS